MYNKFITDPKYYLLLLNIDKELAHKTWKNPCVHCGDKLDQAHYLRKARGGPMVPLETKRYSYCCRRESCRRRSNPLSVRFLGRRVYLSVFVSLFTAMTDGLSDQRLNKIRSQIGISRQALQRWRKWWKQAVPNTIIWKEIRSNLQRPVKTGDLPGSLINYTRINRDLDDAITNFLKITMVLGREEK